MQNLEERPCPECGGRRVFVEYTGYGIIILKQPAHHASIFSNETNISGTRALTCTQCGLTTIYARTPQNLIPNQ
jgi:DNA-directed RNA polymerase subunit RPC12/RpoP